MSSIISRAPYRISLLGGGTDQPSFFQKYKGAVLNFGIDKYIYIIVSKKGDKRIRISYHNGNELVEDVNNIKHPYIKACLNLMEIKEGIEILTFADLSESCGLGSSSTFTVALLAALYKFKGIEPTKRELFDSAITVELALLNKPIGWQDQLAAVYGEPSLFTFEKFDYKRTSCIFSEDTFKNILMFNFEKRANRNDILIKERRNINKNFLTLKEMANDAIYFNSQNLGKMIAKNWEQKKSLSNRILPEMETLYEKALEAGAEGGKNCGAGGGGYFLIYSNPKYHSKIREIYKEHKELKFNPVKNGVEIKIIEDIWK